MKIEDATAVIGAGPYGLSVAAYLRARGVPTLVFGKAMEFWQKMPAGIYLKSSMDTSTMFDPASTYSLKRYFQMTATTHQEPVPLPVFLNYGQWFQQNAVPDIDPTYVQALTRDGKSFLLDLADGRSVKARRVVVAVGISRFAYVPGFARNLPATLASHAQEHSSFEAFSGKRVVVVGSGQSALECSALLNEASAQVELIARGSVIWINRVLYDRTGPAKHIFYPSSDVGPPGINWLISFPLLFRCLPDQMRHMVHKRAIRPSGAKWLRGRVEDYVHITESTCILEATEQGETLCLKLSDGTTRTVDHLFLGTGYEPGVEKLEFLDPTLLQQVKMTRGYPRLNNWFESSVPHLHFVGALAGNNFGPLCHFVVGAKVSAQQITQHATRVT